MLNEIGFAEKINAGKRTNKAHGPNGGCNRVHLIEVTFDNVHAETVKDGSCKNKSPEGKVFTDVAGIACIHQRNGATECDEDPHHVDPFCFCAEKKYAKHKCEKRCQGIEHAGECAADAGLGTCEEEGRNEITAHAHSQKTFPMPQ